MAERGAKLAWWDELGIISETRPACFTKAVRCMRVAASDKCGNWTLRERGETTCMVKVSATGNEPLDKVLKRFKKKCEKEGLIRDIKRSSYYEKPSERRRRKLRKMIKRARKALAEQQAYYK